MLVRYLGQKNNTIHTVCPRERKNKIWKMGKSPARNLVAVCDNGANTIEETAMNTIPSETVPALNVSSDLAGSLFMRNR